MITVPKKLERELKATAKKEFPGDEERQDAYTYGTLRKTGWKPSRERKLKKPSEIARERKSR